MDETGLNLLPTKTRRYLSPHKSNIEDEDDTSPITNMGIIAKLEHFKCVIRGKIVVDDKDKVYVKYVKCSFINGSIAYIEVEGEYDEEDMSTVMKRTNSNNIENSVKYGSFNLCYPDVDGVVFEHVDHFVVIESDEEMNPHEVTYTLKQETNIAKIELDRPKSYPLVKFSNLCSNCDVLSKNISLCFSRLTDIENEDCKKDLIRAKSTISKLDMMLRDIEKKFILTSNGLKNDNLKLSRALSKFSTDPSKYGDKIERVKYNLSIRKEYLKNLCTLMGVVDVLNIKLSPVMENIVILQKQLNTYYELIGQEEVRD